MKTRFLLVVLFWTLFFKYSYSQWAQWPNISGIPLFPDYIFTGDNVGIDTYFPAAKLHINTGNGDLVKLESTFGALIIGNVQGNHLALDNNEIMAKNINSTATLHLQAEGGELRIHDIEPGVNTLVLFDDQGNVGIGTNNIPANYSLAVDGNIIAEEVRIQLSENWPDYVFDENYYLMPLDQLESYIRKNHHLPGIFSAEEIKESGQYLGEVQRKMLEKLEEQALYILQLKNENDQIKMRIKKLEELIFGQSIDK